MTSLVQPVVNPVVKQPGLTKPDQAKKSCCNNKTWQQVTGKSGITIASISTICIIAAAILFFAPIVVAAIVFKATLIAAAATAVTALVLLISYAILRSRASQQNTKPNTLNPAAINSEIAARDARNAELTQQLKALRDHTETVEAEAATARSALEAKVVALKEQMTGGTHEGVAEHAAKLTEAQQQLKALHTKIDEVEKQLEAALAEKAQLTQEKSQIAEKLNAAVEDASAQAQLLTKTKQLHETEAAEWEEQNNLFKAEIQQLKATNGSLKSALEAGGNETVNTLTTQLATSDSALTAANANVAHLNGQVDQLVAQKLALTNTVAELQKKLDEANAGHASVKDQLSQVEALLAATKGAIDEKHAAIEALTTKHDAVVEEKKALEAKVAHLEEQHGKAQSVFSDVEKAKKELAAKTEQHDKVHAELEALKAEHAQLVAQKATHGEIENKFTTLKENFGVLSKEIEQLQTEKKATAGELGEANAKVASLTADKAQLESELTKVKEEASQLQEKVDVKFKNRRGVEVSAKEAVDSWRHEAHKFKAELDELKKESHPAVAEESDGSKGSKKKKKEPLTGSTEQPVLMQQADKIMVAEDAK